MYIVIAGIVFGQESQERILQLKSGDRLSGTLVSENDSSIVLQTSFGEVLVLKSSIKPQSITIYLKDGNIVSGDIISNIEGNFVLNTTFGRVTIDKNNIDRTSEAGATLPGTQKQEEFYYGNERLIDIFFDPTGYTMEKGSIYFSGLSWGVALSENVDVSSSYWRYFMADLNVRPKFRLAKMGDVESEQSFAVGFHLHTAGHTGKQKIVNANIPRYDPYGGAIISYEMTKQWESVGNGEDSFLWTELFAAVTTSNLKSDKQGRISYHAGASVILHRVATMPRIWLAFDSDITSRFKIIGQVYYDAFQPSFKELTQDRVNDNPFDLDFGFVYAHNENLRFGIHFQPYIILFYFKF